MYTPASFAVSAAEAEEFLQQLVAADLVTHTESGIDATFLPLIFDAANDGGFGSLRGHLARNNPQWQRQPTGEVLVIAHGPNAYVSPGWYASKAEHGRVVPTWNYATAHIYGHLTVHDDERWLGQLVRELTDRHEAGRNRPWAVDDAPAEFVAGQLRAIVGIEVAISRVEVKMKMSQNRPDGDFEGIVAGLEADGRADVADLVRKHFKG
jgi:transcriptional regulator